MDFPALRVSLVRFRAEDLWGFEFGFRAVGHSSVSNFRV